jgi:HEAT repeat protein
MSMAAKEDTRSVTELFDVALNADENTAWEALSALHWRGSREVLDRALVLAASNDPVERALAADVFGQLGVPERNFPDQCFEALKRLLFDESGKVVSTAITAFYHLDCQRAAPLILPFADHPDDQIRYAVAFALGGVDTAEVTAVLLKLMTDRDADVRNWATFGVGHQIESDSDESRSALAARLADDDEDVRCEAVYGLGLRCDDRAVGYLKTMLHEDPEDFFAREAATALLALDEEPSTAELLGALERRQRWRRQKDGG